MFRMSKKAQEGVTMAILGIVAVLAVVGLVLLFKGGAGGGATGPGFTRGCPILSTDITQHICAHCDSLGPGVEPRDPELARFFRTPGCEPCSSMCGGIIIR